MLKSFMNFKISSVFSSLISSLLILLTTLYPSFAQENQARPAESPIQFEKNKQQWEAEHAEQVKMLDDKEARLEQIKQALLSKIQQFEQDKEANPSVPDQEASAAAQAALKAERALLEEEKKQFAQLQSAGPEQILDQNTKVQLQTLNSKLEEKDKIIVELRQSILKLQKMMTEKESQRTEEIKSKGQ